MALLDARLSNAREGGPSFTLRHRLFRAVWSACWWGLCAWTPAPLHRWRRLVLVLFGARVHPTARVYGSVRIWYPANLEMGRHAVLGRNVICYNMDRITIGDHAVVSQGTHLCAGTHDPDDPHFQLVTEPIVIGEGAWVAAEAFVGPGVVIGDGAVLGARAVTFRSLEPMTVHAGNPAKRLRRRLFAR
jgi:putative colanic acid biosynthesis acetyltransferase WcaF